MSLNGVKAVVFCVITLNALDFKANFVKLVEARRTSVIQRM